MLSSLCSNTRKVFYQSVLESLLFYAALCWGSILVSDKLVPKTGSVTGTTMGMVVERWTLKTLFALTASGFSILIQISD